MSNVLALTGIEPTDPTYLYVHTDDDELVLELEPMPFRSADAVIKNLILGWEQYVPEAVGVVVAINCGDDEDFTGDDGIWYEADDLNSYFSGGTPNPGVDQPISGTLDDDLYRTLRYSDAETEFSYDIPIVNGTYTVILKFTEEFEDSIGLRVFDITIEGNVVAENLDIFEEVGGEAAYDLVVGNVVVADAELNIVFTDVVGDAIVSAIVVEGDPAPVKDITTFQKWLTATYGTQTYMLRAVR